MAGSQKLIPLVGVCLLLQLTAGQQQFSFPNFSSDSNLEATGYAHQKEGEFWLTDYSSRTYGALRYNKSMRLCDPSSGYMASFVTSFTFKIEKAQQVNADGLAFTIAPDKLATSNATFGRWLGMFSNHTNGNDSNKIVAVEFDTYKNSGSNPYDYGCNDIDDNHVGVDLHGIWSANQSSLYRAGVSLGSGRDVTAKIDYNAKEQRLRVYVSHDPSSPSLESNPVLDHTFKLCAYIEDESFVGFSAATGLANLDYHKILSWNFAFYDPSKAGPPTGTSQGLLAGIIVLAAVAALGAVAVAAWLLLRKRQKQKVDLVLLAHEIPYNDLVVATDNFNQKNLLGKGGFGSVFKGQLARGKSPVAVKRMSEESRQGEREFLAEVTTISQLSHRNLVKLRGWCRHKKQLILVYDFMPRGSVHDLMFGSSDQPAVPWETRHHILCGIAAALLYLHEEWEMQVVHRDVKLSNVLLDAGMNARLGDFGLARTAEHGLKLPTTNLAGTIGYIAPEVGVSLSLRLLQTLSVLASWCWKWYLEG